MRSKSLFLFFFLATTNLMAQRDTLHVMVYNLLNFPSATATPNRQDTLRKILHYDRPDILMVCELNNATGSNQIINTSLNSMGVTHYAAANYVTNRSTSDNHQNMLYYNTQKVGLKSQTELLTDLRDINEYIIYFKDPNLALHNDTTFARLFVTHLKAGTSGTDISRRNGEVQVLVNYMNTFPSNFNGIFAGDFNTYTSSEACYQTLISTGSHPFFDPIGTPGAWSNNASFAAVHTQSTRVASFNGGATSGLDDRFDHITVTEPVLTGLERLRYIPGTYHALGQDGNHYNVALIDPPANPTIPDSVRNALYYMSDHLPVVMDLEVEFPQLLPATEMQWAVQARGPKVQMELHWTGKEGVRNVRIERRAMGTVFETWKTFGDLHSGALLQTMDEDPMIGRSAYRVVMEDANGQTLASEERQVIYGEEAILTAQFMNPATAEGTFLWMEAGAPGRGTLEVFDWEGRILLAKSLEWENGNIRQWIPFTGFAEGLYGWRIRPDRLRNIMVGKILILPAQ
jgi:hypothetical protein